MGMTQGVGNESRGSFKGNPRRWFIGVIPFPRLNMIRNPSTIFLRVPLRAKPKGPTISKSSSKGRFRNDVIWACLENWGPQT